MSKKGKEKKKEESSPEAELIEQQKRELLEQSFTIKRLQDRLSLMAEENHGITTTHDQLQQDYEERIDKQRIIIESHESNIKENRLKIYDLEVAKMTLEGRNKDLQRQLREQEAMKNRELDDYRRITQSEITKLEMQLKEYNTYMNERDEMSTQNRQLKDTLDVHKEDKTRELADKEREKVQAVDRLRDEMLTKINKMRTNLLSLKKDQLDTTIKLAVLQNHQLTSELEFQSKQSEKLIFENEQMQRKISHLQKDLQIHKEIEEELAKRSHYSRGIIKKLTSKIADLQQQLKDTSPGKEASPSRDDDSHQREQIIKVLDKNLQSSEKKYIKLQSETDLTRNELKMLRSKIDGYEKRAGSLVEILLRAYSLYDDDELKGSEGGYQIDLKAIREKPVDQWSSSEARLVTNAILQQLATFLNRKLLGLPPPPRPEEQSVLDSDETINNVKLPKISDHSTNSRVQLSMKLRDLPVSLGSKLVSSQVRGWGRTVHSSSHANLQRKYKVYDK